MPTFDLRPKFQRILLKLSGEALMGDGSFGIDPAVLEATAKEVQSIHELGVQVGVVIGGGNIYRGAALQASGMDRVTGDQMGMLATVMNALAMRDTLQRLGLKARVMSAFPMPGVAEAFDHQQAKQVLSEGEVVLFAAGTGSPFFTTDTAACLRGIEIDADLVLKATKVDGVYNADPNKDPDAVKFDQLSYEQVLSLQLGVMDLTAICLVRDHNMPVRVFNMHKTGALRDIIVGGEEGTLVSGASDDQ